VKTSVEVSPGLLDRARRAANLTSDQETIVAALEEFSRKREREELRRLAGRIFLEIDLARSRGRRPR
jgi:hypothetical protein